MSFYQDNTEYSCLHYYWDEKEREYEIAAVWLFEKNYPDMPDYWHLQSLEVINQVRYSPALDCSKTGFLWKEIESEGIDLETLEEVDHYEP